MNRVGVHDRGQTLDFTHDNGDLVGKKHTKDRGKQVAKDNRWNFSVMEKLRDELAAGTKGWGKDGLGVVGEEIPFLGRISATLMASHTRTIVNNIKTF